VELLIFDEPGSWDDADSFAGRVRPILAEHPVETSVLGSWIQHAMDSQLMDRTDWLLLLDAGRPVPVGAAMRTVRHDLVLAPLADTVRDRAVDALARRLAVEVPDLPGVSARPEDAEAFAQAWRRQGGRAARVEMADHAYQIRYPPAGPDVPGRGRPTGPADSAHLLGWLAAFYSEALGAAADAAREQAEARLARGSLLIWDVDGEAVSLAGLTGPALGVARVGPVYTPPQRRGQGYAGAITAFAAREALARGATICMLYADIHNPTSNHVYSDLGFERAGALLRLEFTA
jgi:GNAT superfamily N-acetyltransferase